MSGFIIKELSGIASNWRSNKSLDEFLREFNVAGIQGIDTRALTRHIRDKGAQQGIISTSESDPDKLVAQARALPGLEGRDLVREVSCSKPYDWVEGVWDIARGYNKSPLENPKEPRNHYFVVAYDLGIKLNILRKLTEAGCKVKVVPADTGWQEVLAMKPDGVFFSNGPGDPSAVGYAIENARNLFGKVPVFGICLGHQIVNLALGAKTFKLKFGHHGGNQPIMDLSGGRVEITSQNHGFAVDPGSLKDDMETASINLNDKTLEGIRHKKFPLLSVQYHPEASPGPNDSSHLFHEFVKLMEENSPNGPAERTD